MGLKEQISAKYKDSMKSKNIQEINTLRLILSAIKDKEIDNRTKSDSKEINDEQILILLQNLIKQRKDSIESFEKANRKDLVIKESDEIEIISNFLPKQLSQEEVKDLIKSIIDEKKLSSIKDMGAIMNFLKSKYSGSVDMGLAGKIAKDLLNI